MSRQRILRRAVYIVLLATIGWQGTRLIGLLRRAPFVPERSVTVSVSGNVARPGTYRVPEGTTRFEILKVAGVTTTSDLSPFDLSGQVGTDEQLAVGSLDSPVSIKAGVRLEFYFGQLSILALDGMQRPAQEGLTLNQGDRIITEEKSQAEVSLNEFSRIDLDSYTEIVFDRIGTDEEGRDVIDAFQKTGVAWHKIVYSEKAEQFRVLTPFVSIGVGGKGADFTVDVKYSQIDISNTEGLLLVQRPDGTEEANLIAGQNLTVYSDGRPFAVSRLAEGQDITERFSQLTQAKTEMVMRHMPLNFVLCALPGAFYFVSVQFESGVAHVVRIAPEVSVRDFVQGFATIQEAFLYGGPVFMTTLVERIMSTRVPKYAVFAKDDVVRAVSALGGIIVDVDGAASKSLGIPRGRYNLTPEQVLEFLKPSVSGSEDAAKRQMEIMRAVFEAIRTKNIVVTSLMAEQILSGLEANIQVAEAMKHYANFSSREKWQFKTHTLPTTTVKDGSRSYEEPKLEECRKLLTRQ